MVGLLLFPLVVAALLLAGLAVWGLIGLLIMKDISAPEFAVYLSVFLFLALLMAANWGGPLMLGAMGAMALLAVGFPLARRLSDRRALDRIDEEDMVRYEVSVRKRPEIPYPYRRLAELRFKRGDYAGAAEWYRRYLERAPQDESEYRHRIARCMELTEQAAQRPRPCPDCRRISPQEARYCTHCGSVLPGWWELVGLFRGKAGLRYLLVVAAASLVVAVVLGLAAAIHPILVVLCFWIAAAAFTYYVYKRVTAC